MRLIRFAILVFIMGISFSVNAWVDSDLDGVPDKKDACPNTPPDIVVKANGCHEEYLVQTPEPSATEVTAPENLAHVDTQAALYACLLTSSAMPANSHCDTVTVSPVYFDFAKSQVLMTQYPLLARVAELVKQRPELKLTLIGHADIIGSAGFNQTLSVKRAQNVKAVLVAQYGLMGSDIVYRGVGNTMPVDDNKTANGRQGNRRVEIIID